MRKGKLIIVKFKSSTPYTTESEKVKKKILNLFWGAGAAAPGLVPALATALVMIGQTNYFDLSLF